MSEYRLTDRQQEVLTVLAYETQDGWPISIRQLGRLIDCGPPTTWTFVERLRRLGLAETRGRQGTRATQQGLYVANPPKKKQAA